MSNVSGINPVAAVAGGLAAVCVVAPVMGTIALAKWLAAETEAEKAMLAAVREKRRQTGGIAESSLPLMPGPALTIPQCSGAGAVEAAHGPMRFDQTVDGAAHEMPSAPIITARLHVRDMDSLVQSAMRLGFQPQPLLAPSLPLSRQSQVLLSKPSGERMVLQRSKNGRIALSTIGEPERIQNVVRQHSLDRVVDHLATRMGMEVKLARLQNGEVQILGREQGTAKRGGSAVVRTQVHADGSLVVDVDQIKGNRCEEIVSGLAEAVGGQITGTRKKDNYWQLPGEPTKTKVTL